MPFLHTLGVGWWGGYLFDYTMTPVWTVLNDGHPYVWSGWYCGNGSVYDDNLANLWADNWTIISASTEYNLTVNVFEVGTYNEIPNALVELHLNNWFGGIISGYTDVNGTIVFQQQDINPNEEVRIFANGYDYRSFLFTPYDDMTIYADMTPNGQLTPVPTPSGNVTPTPTQITGAKQYSNVTYTIRDFNGGAPVQGAIIEHFHNAQSWVTGAGTNAGGRETFYGVPHYVDEVQHFSIFATGYNTLTNAEILMSGNTPDIYMTFYIVKTMSATPTPSPFDTWTLYVSPTGINLGSSALLSATCSNSLKELGSQGLQTVLYYENNNLGAYSTFNLIGVYRYNVSTMTWDFRVNNNVPWIYSSEPSPLDLTVTPITTGTYTYQVATFSNQSVSWGSDNVDLTVGGGGVSGTLTMLLFAGDALTTDHLSDYTLTLTDDVTGTVHDYGVIPYDISINLGRGKSYTATCTKEGYEDGTRTFIVPVNPDIQQGDFGAMINIDLFRTGNLPTAGNTTITVHVDDIETYYPIPNVKISLGATGVSVAPKFTGTSGESVFFVIPQNKEFTVTALKDGYCSVSQTKNTSTQSTMYVPLYMKFGACLGVTPTHTPIPNATPIIIIPTPIGGYGNLSGGAGVCNSTFTNVSWIQKVRNYVACLGIEDLLTQNMLIGLLIILGIGLIAAWKAKVLGFAIGAVLGALIAMSLGLIPFWWIVVLIICSIAIISIKIFTSSNSGG
jgi:hypothetical protein